jgi:antitoxin component YwqK of YwqJK toxin-antitoxin module
MLRLTLFFSILASSVLCFAQDTVNQTDPRGRKQGFWTRSGKEGNRIYDGWFLDDIPVGKFTYYYPNGMIRTVSWMSDGGTVARTTSWFPNGKLMARGNYLHEKRDSIWQFFSELDGSLVSEENYCNGVKNGAEKLYYPGKGLAEVVGWKEGKKEGPWKQFYDDGTLKLDGTYHMDEKEGILRTYYVSGQLLSTGQYVNGHQDGLWIYYDNTGKVTLKEQYEKGLLLKSE